MEIVEIIYTLLQHHRHRHSSTSQRLSGTTFYRLLQKYFLTFYLNAFKLRHYFRTLCVTLRILNTFPTASLRSVWPSYKIIHPFPQPSVSLSAQISPLFFYFEKSLYSSRLWAQSTMEKQQLSVDILSCASAQNHKYKKEEGLTSCQFPLTPFRVILPPDAISLSIQ